MSKFNKRQIALTMAFASLLGGKSSALDKSLDYNAIGNQKLNANDKVSGKISAGKILAFLIPAVVVGAVATNEIFNKKYNIRSFYKKYIAKSNDEKPNEDKPNDDSEKKNIGNEEQNIINKIEENKINKNPNINNFVKNREKGNNNLIMESNINIQTDATENKIKEALGEWCKTCFAAFKKACDAKGIKSEEDMLRIANVFSRVADKLSKEKAFDKNFAALFNLFKNKDKVNSIEILNFAANNEKFTITVSHQVFTIEFKEEKEFRIRVNKDASGEFSSTNITLSFN